ncbi:hypothetical protein SprV_0100141900 [Sparganum proliferum]
MPSLPVCLKCRPTSASTSRPLPTKPSGPCISSPAGKHLDRTRSLLRSTNTVVPNSWITWLRSSRRCGVKEKSRRILKTPQSCIYTSGRDAASSPTTTEASPADGMIARVTDSGTVSETFAVTTGVRKGCVLAPPLFSLMFSAMLMDAYRDERPGIRIAYKTGGHLLNKRRMHFQSPVSTTTIYKLLFADECSLITTLEEEMQRSMDLFSATCENFGLVINTQRTVVMHQPPPRAANQCERNPNASGGELPVSGQHPLPQHQNR